jgi:hypothetical protein
MEIPRLVSGRPVTRRGVHLQPSGQHTGWMVNRDYWLGLLVDMGMSWVTALSDSDAILTSGAAKALLDAGIIPIIRFAHTFPRPWTHAAGTKEKPSVVERAVKLYAQYGAPCIVQVANEPFDIREWVNKKVPPYEEAWGIIARTWEQAAREIVACGAIAGFPDGPCYSENPFMRIESTHDLWYVEKCVYLGHFYAKGRPLRFPYDDVSQNGTQLTMEEYRAALDDYADDPAWNEGEYTLARMNVQRRAWACPGKTAIDDDTCFNGWQKVVHWSNETFGFTVPIAMTEGGWVPRDRAGSSIVDIRWPMTTPNKVAENTVAMFEADTPMFALTPWLLASQDMGASGWPDDCWVGYAFSDKYGREKPVVQALRETAPAPVENPHPSTADRVRRALGLVDEALETAALQTAALEEASQRLAVQGG